MDARAELARFAPNTDVHDVINALTRKAHGLAPAVYESAMNSGCTDRRPDSGARRQLAWDLCQLGHDLNHISGQADYLTQLSTPLATHYLEPGLTPSEHVLSRLPFAPSPEPQPERQAPTVSVVSSALRPGHIVREHGMRVRIDEVRPYASSSSSRDAYPTAYSCPGTVLNVAQVREAGIVPLGFLACSVHPGGRCWHVQGNDLARWAVERHATDCRECRQIIETCTCGSQLCEGWRHMARESHWCVAAQAGQLGCKATPDPEAPEHELG